MVADIFMKGLLSPRTKILSQKLRILGSRGCVRAHMLICIYAQGQSKYISGFSLILFFYHIPFAVHTLWQFFSYFALFCCCSIHFKSLSFRHSTLICFHLGTCIPVCHAESNYTIAHAHLGTLSRVEAGATYDFIDQKLGICRLRHSLAFPCSVFWQSLRWEPTVSILLLYQLIV